MKVLLIDVNCKQSSTGKIVYDLYHNLNKDGHTAAVCYGRGDLVSENNIYKFGIDFETKLHAALARLTGLNGCFSFFSTRRLLRFIKAFRPDVVHIHELHAYFVNLKPLLRYLKKESIPVVWTFHCEYMYTGKCGHAYECTGFQRDCGHCSSVKEYPKSLFLDRTRKMLRDKKALLSDMNITIATPSRWLADRVALSFLKDKPLSVIHNGIDTEHVFYPRADADIAAWKEEYGLTGKKIVLSVAPNIMSESKGGDKVVEISRRFTEDNVHFVLVGAEEDGTVGDKVTLIRRTKNQDELALWYSAADVFLICSKKENFPTTCLEALACGTPVVGIDAGGTKETAPAPYGLFFEAEDLSGMSDAIRHYLTENDDRAAVADLAKTLYSRAAMYRQYASLYEATASEKQS